MSKRVSLQRQISKIMEKKYDAGKGVSKHEIKNAPANVGKSQAEKFAGKIFSPETYKGYERQALYFGQFCKENYGCRTVGQCREHIQDWADKLVDEGKSAWTVRHYIASALKLYDGSCVEYNLPSRCRADIKRSRYEVENDKHFSEEKNAKLVDFCRHTGLRNDKELAALRGGDVKLHGDGNYYVIVRNGKGGKVRESRILGDLETQKKYVAKINSVRGNQKVWPEIQSHADVHDYRHEYAVEMYRELARPPETLPRQERYMCQKDYAGIWLDRKALEVVSVALGHSHPDAPRAQVVVGHYIYRSDIADLLDAGVAFNNGTLIFK